MTDLIKKDGNLVFYFDDILVNTSYAEYLHLAANTSFYTRYLDLLNLETEESVKARDNKSVLRWKLKKFKDISMNQLGVIYGAAYDHFVKDMLNTDMYKELQPTEFASKSLRNPVFYNSVGISKIYIVIKYNEAHKEGLQSKRDFIKNWFTKFDKLDKFEIIEISNKENDATVIKEKVPNWNLLVTDDTRVIEQLSKDDIDHKEFMIPRFGYVKLDPMCVELIKQKSGTLTTFDLK